MENSNAEEANSENEIMPIVENGMDTEQQVESLQKKEKIECSTDDFARIHLDFSSEAMTPVKRKSDPTDESRRKRQRSTDQVQNNDSSPQSSIDVETLSPAAVAKIAIDNEDVPNKTEHKSQFPDSIINHTEKLFDSGIAISSGMNKNASTPESQHTSDDDGIERSNVTPPDAKPPNTSVRKLLRKPKMFSRQFTSSECSSVNLETSRFEFENNIRLGDISTSSEVFKMNNDFMNLQYELLESASRQEHIISTDPPASPERDNTVSSTVEDNSIHISSKAYQQMILDSLKQSVIINLEKVKARIKENAENLARRDFSNGKTFKEMLKEYEAEDHEKGECSRYYPKFKEYPGLAEEPDKVKKDARFQKRFYKHKSVVLPVDWEDKQNSSSKLNAEPELYNEQDDDQLQIIGEFPPNHLKNNKNLASPIESEVYKTTFYEDENSAHPPVLVPITKDVSADVAPGYKINSFVEESPSYSPRSNSSGINDRPQKCLLPTFETSKKCDKMLDTLAWVASSATGIPPTEDEISEFSQDDVLGKHLNCSKTDLDEQIFAYVKYNCESIMDEKTIFCRSATPNDSCSLNSLIRLEGQLRIQNLTRRNNEFYSIEEFLCILRSISEGKPEDSDNRIKSFTTEIPLFKIPMLDHSDPVGNNSMQRSTAVGGHATADNEMHASMADVHTKSCKSLVDIHNSPSDDILSALSGKSEDSDNRPASFYTGIPLYKSPVQSDLYFIDDHYGLDGNTLMQRSPVIADPTSPDREVHATMTDETKPCKSLVDFQSSPSSDIGCIDLSLKKESDDENTISKIITKNLPRLMKEVYKSSSNKPSFTVSTSKTKIPPAERKTTVVTTRKKMKMSKSSTNNGEKNACAYVRFNFSEILDDKAIFCRDILYTPPSNDNPDTPIPLKSYFRIVESASPDDRHCCVEEFLFMLLTFQQDYIQWHFDESIEIYNFFRCIPVFKIPKKLPCFVPDNEYKHAMRLTNKIHAPKSTVQESNANQKKGSEDAVNVAASDHIKCTDFDEVGSEEQTCVMMDLESEDDQPLDCVTKNVRHQLETEINKPEKDLR